MGGLSCGDGSRGRLRQDDRHSCMLVPAWSACERCNAADQPATAIVPWAVRALPASRRSAALSPGCEATPPVTRGLSSSVTMWPTVCHRDAAAPRGPGRERMPHRHAARHRYRWLLIAVDRLPPEQATAAAWPRHQHREETCLIRVAAADHPAAVSVARAGDHVTTPADRWPMTSHCDAPPETPRSLVRGGPARQAASRQGRPAYDFRCDLPRAAPWAAGGGEAMVPEVAAGRHRPAVAVLHDSPAAERWRTPVRGSRIRRTAPGAAPPANRVRRQTHNTAWREAAAARLVEVRSGQVVAAAVGTCPVAIVCRMFVSACRLRSL